jgi:hypothetical protein
MLSYFVPVPKTVSAGAMMPASTTALGFGAAKVVQIGTANATNKTARMIDVR